MVRNPQRVLLVEGDSDLRVIPELIEINGIDWGTRKNPIVYIREYGGYSNLIDPTVISTELKASGLKSLGIIVDTDENPESRWQSVRNCCLESIPDLPDQLPAEGLIHRTSEGINLGIWMMPDNRLRGMLETFLAYLVPSGNEPLWDYAQEVVQVAKDKGANFTDHQIDKAKIYTWLAWQNEPGRQLHQAIKERILDARHPRSQAFVAWFKQLYELTGGA